jgi:uncharacterized damage-inducible protein DinB
VELLEHYDILIRARRKLLSWVRELTAEQYRQEFPFGLRTVRATLVHLAGSEWLHGRAARGEDLTAGERPFTEECYPDFLALERAWQDLEAGTRAWLQSESGRTRRMETIARRGNAGLFRVGFTREALAFQLFYHEVHHRAQAWPCCDSLASQRRAWTSTDTPSSGRSWPRTKVPDQQALQRPNQALHVTSVAHRLFQWMSLCPMAA